MALVDGPLRTRELTRCVPGYAPRTVYRYATRLAELGAIDRKEEPGVPSKVVHRLTDPCGIELCELAEAYARAALEILPDGRIVPHSWGSLTLLAELWESGMYEALNQGPRTATELARLDHDLSFHQVARRINLFLDGGFIRETDDKERRRRYELTKEARQSTALIVGLGRWRERHAVPVGEAGLTPVETAELLRAAMPLVALPEHAGVSLKLSVAPPGEGEENGEVVWAEVGRDGTVCDGIGPLDHPHGWARGEVGHWIEALLRGTKSKVRFGGDGSSLVRVIVREMHEALWDRQRT